MVRTSSGQKEKKQLKERLRTLLVTRYTEKNKHGATIVPQEAARWIQHPAKEDPTTGGWYRAVQRSAKAAGPGFVAADWFWGLVKELQRSGEISTHLVRMQAGGSQDVGWRSETPGRLETGANWMGYVRTVRAACRRHGEPRHGGVWVAREAMTAIWQSTKRWRGVGMTANTLKAALWEVAATSRVAVQDQQTDAKTGGAWRSREWWDLVEQELEMRGMESGFTTTTKRTQAWMAALAEEKGNIRDVWLHLCAGKGSGMHGAATDLGHRVLAVDISAQEAQMGVTRLKMDLTAMSWELWVLQACAESGTRLEQLAGAVAGPPCATFNHGDASNERQGHWWNYRNHSDDSKPPQHEEGTKKGDLARAHDWLAEGMMRAYTRVGTRMPWLMENPEAHLQCRPYMREVKGCKRTVHYCAYWNESEARTGPTCRKATNLWTNVQEWTSKGSTGTGKCGMRCKWGWRSDKGWVHQALQGATVAVKQRTPKALMAEWMEAAMQRQRH
jgi:hypothetical protein